MLYGLLYSALGPLSVNIFKAILKSNHSVMDDEWHSIRAEREGVAGTLYIDDMIEANGQSPAGTDAVDTHPPFYIGGLPPDLVPFATRILPVW